jgi:hypothetical protein
MCRDTSKVISNIQTWQYEQSGMPNGASITKIKSYTFNIYIYIYTFVPLINACLYAEKLDYYMFIMNCTHFKDY